MLRILALSRYRLPREPGLWAHLAIMAVVAKRPAALGGPLPGVGACLLGSACYAASYVYARRFLTGRGLPALVLSTGQIAAGVALLVLATPVVAHTPVTLTATVIASVLVLGVLATGVAYVLNYQLRVRASRRCRSRHRW